MSQFNILLMGWLCAQSYPTVEFLCSPKVRAQTFLYLEEGSAIAPPPSQGAAHTLLVQLHLCWKWFGQDGIGPLEVVFFFELFAGVYFYLTLLYWIYWACYGVFEGSIVFLWQWIITLLDRLIGAWWIDCEKVLPRCAAVINKENSGLGNCSIQGLIRICVCVWGMEVLLEA